MARLRVLPGTEACRILAKAGFVEVRRRGSHIVIQKRTSEMKLYLCRFVSDEALQQLPNKDAYEIVFHFPLTPIGKVGQPDEERHVEHRDVRLTVDGMAFCDRGIPLDVQDKLRVLYFHAVETLKRGEDTLEIDRQYAHDHYADPNKIVYPPLAPFEIALIQKMGFR